MAIEELLQQIEEYLDKDLKGEKLSRENQTKRKQLAVKVRDAIEEQNKEKLGKHCSRHTFVSGVVNFYSAQFCFVSGEKIPDMV